MARGGVQTPPRRGAKPAVGEDGSAGAGAAARAGRGAGAGADCAGVVETQRSARGYCGRAIRPKQSREKGKKCAHKKRGGAAAQQGVDAKLKRKGVKSERRSAVPNSLASQLAALGSRIPPRRRRAAAAEA